MKSWDNLIWKSYRLPTSPVRCSHCTFGNPNVIFNSIIHTHFWLFALSHKKTICNPLAHPTWKCHHTDLWIAKLFHLTEGLLRYFRRWRLWKEPVVGCHRWLRKEPVVTATGMPGKQCHSKCSEWPRSALKHASSLFGHFGRTVHHAVLKFSPRRNKPLP